MLHFYRLHGIWQISSTFSHLWTFIDNLCYTTQIIGFAWASIERHILVFHNTWVLTQKKRFLVHYLPLIIICTYCLIYFIVFALFPFCGDYSSLSPTNGVPALCTFFSPIVPKYDTICHQIIPTMIIIIFSLALLVRALKQRTRLNRAVNWRKQRKMTIQLLSMSTIYFLFNFPRTIIQLLLLIGLSTKELENAYSGTLFFAIYIIFLFPFICCGSTPELGQKLKKLFFCQKLKQRVIVPEDVPIHHLKNDLN